MSNKNDNATGGFLGGFTTGRANVERADAMGSKGKVFDWHKAAQLIKERKPKRCEAGLSGDWSSTGGTIYENGKPAESYTYLASRWATPILDIDGEEIECWIEQDGNEFKWSANTYWPQSALDILD